MASGAFVVTANAWMNTPAGFTLDEAGAVLSIDPLEAMLNPNALHSVLHMLAAAIASVAAGFRLEMSNQWQAQMSMIAMPGANGAQGGPGAMTNQPPVPPAAPINGPGQQLPQAGAGAAAGQPGRESRREATTNFEVDKTVRVVRNASGNLKRLTAAVVVNHRRVLDDEGKATLTPLDAKEVEQIQSLVREAIGFTKDRGDALNVVNAPFSVEEIPVVEPTPIWKDPSVLSTARGIGMQLGLVLLGLLAIFGVIRPALKRPPVPAPRPGSGSSTVVANDVALPPPSDPNALNAPSEAALKLARDNPATVANVVRGWVNT
jgi:flagellar M-ring protein FliF